MEHIKKQKDYPFNPFDDNDDGQDEDNLEKTTY